jgi:N-acetylglucosamine-6-phosphate deacetylase
MGCDVACKAEAASPLTGRKFGNYHAAYVQLSVSGQIIAEGNHINYIMNTSSIEGIQVKENC